MRRRLTAILAALALAIALIPAPQAHASFYVTYYTVTYVCICGPVCYGTIVGQWTRGCDGVLSGWGVPPYDGDPCHSTSETYGNECVL